MTRTTRPPDAADLDRARDAVRAVLAPTPVIGTGLVPDGTLKLETFQPTGSFKVRGALAALAALPPGATAVTASAGNHGLGMAFAAARTGADATVVVSTNASPAKVAAIGAFPVRLVEHGADFDEAEVHALSLPGTYVSAYNDPHVIAGQATIGAELDDQVPGPLTVVAPLGGGGLLSGLALWAERRGDVRVVGVESAASRAVSTAVAAGRVVPVEVGDSIADGLVGNVEDGCVTPEVLRGRAELTAVTDAELRTAMRALFTEHGLVVEGSGAAGLAAILAGRVRLTGRTVIVLSGRNITIPTYTEALSHD